MEAAPRHPAGEGRGKGCREVKAIARWPANADLFKLVKHDGRAEAALIAAAGMMLEVLTMAEPFASMIGGEVLTYIRDAVAKVAVDKRTFLDQSAAVGGTPLGKDELAEVRAPMRRRTRSSTR